MLVSEVKEWLNTLEDNEGVGIDDGGIALCSTDRPDAYLELGGISLDEEE